MEREFVKIAEAARFLAISQATLQNWIARKYFTAADGLRRFGGSTRIHMPTLRARAMADEIAGGRAKPQARTRRKSVARFESTAPAQSRSEVVL